MSATALWHVRTLLILAAAALGACGSEELAAEGDTVVVIDQTGGTGDFTTGRTDTRVSTYEAPTGESRWQVDLPGAPHLMAGAGSSLVIPNGTMLLAIDATSGSMLWETDTGSPSRGGRYSSLALSAYRFVQPADGVTEQVLGWLSVADEPYRD